MTDVGNWFRKYSVRRYGKDNNYTGTAWQILARNVFNSSIRNFHGMVLVIRPPQLGLEDIRWYNMTDILTAWDMFVSAADDLGPVRRTETLAGYMRTG